MIQTFKIKILYLFIGCHISRATSSPHTRSRSRTGSRTRMSSFLSAVPVQDNILEMEMAGQGRNYSYMFNFEQVKSRRYHRFIKVVCQEFEHSEVRVWMEDNWQLVCRPVLSRILNSSNGLWFLENEQIL